LDQNQTLHAYKIKIHLDKWGIETKTHITSARKVPEKLISHLKKYNQEDNIVYITIAGRSNGISGVAAGSTHHPVIDTSNAAQLALRILE
jgi:5-(carboxyamino)imidazole ribonucleotide mutase